MKILRNNMYLYLVLVIVMITYIVFIFNKNTDIETKLDEVKLKTEINEISKNSFAIMVEKEDGSGYEEVDNFPEGLPLNEELTGCIDIDGKSLENAITYSNGVVTVNVNSTAYCYLYFNRDATPPESFTFYLGGNSNPTYVTNNNTPTYLKWNDTDIAYYCLTNTQGISNCNWQKTSGTSITPTHTLTSGDGAKTVYAYIKDASGNISPEVSDTVILDSIKPTITSVTKTSDEQTSITVSVVANDDTSKVKSYYYKIGSGAYTSSTSSTHTFTGLTKGTTYNISVYVVDNAGLQSNVGTYTFETKSSTLLSEYLLQNPPTGLYTTLEGDLYRFMGTTANNYICFGTSNKDTCLANTDAYLYRIIGVTKDGKMKMLKKEALNTAMNWYSSAQSNITWPNSTIYSNINAASFLTNKTYVPDGWDDKIETVSWKYGNIVYNDTTKTAANLYSTENAWTNTVNAKIGILALHETYYASGTTASCNISGGCPSWLNLRNNDSSAPVNCEWTMSRERDKNSTYGYYAYYICGEFLMSVTISQNQSIRPVFYLTSDVQFVSGSGTATDPFIIS